MCLLQGFYEQFQWPVYLRAITDEDDGEVDETEQGHQADDVPDPLQVLLLSRLHR